MSNFPEIFLIFYFKLGKIFQHSCTESRDFFETVTYLKVEYIFSLVIQCPTLYRTKERKGEDFDMAS